MKVLLDECVPRKFKNHFPNHECQTVPEAGFAGEKNGQLLSLAERAGFQVFLSLDRGIEYEQNLKKHAIAIILVHAQSSRLADCYLVCQTFLRLSIPFNQANFCTSPEILC
jgi:hypothetical protein